MISKVRLEEEKPKGVETTYVHRKFWGMFSFPVSRNLSDGYT